MAKKHDNAGRERRMGKCLMTSLLLLNLAVLVSCDGINKSEVKPEPKTLTKAQFLARIVVQERYWRIEEISRQQEEQIASVNVREGSPMLNSYYLNEVIPLVSVQLSRGVYGIGKVNETKMSGAYGNVPFGEFQCMLMPQTLRESGEWAWDNERDMLKIALPESIRSIVGALSGSGWLPETGYIASTPAPLFRGVEEARLAASPERIKIRIEQQTVTGIVTYVFTMRAAWVTDVDLRDAEHKYGVSLY